MTFRSLLALVVLRLWPFPRGLDRIVRIVGLPAPAPRLVTRRLRGLPLSLRFNPRTCQGRFLYYRGLCDEALIHKLRQLLRPGMTFVDVGANIGLYSVVASHCVGPTGRVVAFEPQESLAELFWENVKCNRLDNVLLEPVALGRAAGTSSLFQVTENDGQATLRLRPEEQSLGPAEVVTVRRLSDVLRDRGIASVDGMKIDVEGGELEVLQGFEDWMTVAPPQFILVECISRLLGRFGHRSRDLVDFLRGHGYSLYEPWRDRWIPVAPAALPFAKDILALQARFAAMVCGS
jgi:FkbM family methyltransferase